MWPHFFSMAKRYEEWTTLADFSYIQLNENYKTIDCLHGCSSFFGGVSTAKYHDFSFHSENTILLFERYNVYAFSNFHSWKGKKIANSSNSDDVVKSNRLRFCTFNFYTFPLLCFTSPFQF